MTGKDELFLLRALLRASDYGVLLSDSSRHDLVCNRRFCQMFGIDAEDTLPADPEYMRAQVLPRLKDPASFLRTLDEIYADPTRVCEDEIELTLPKRRLIRRYTGPVFDHDGVLIGRLWTFLDITRTRRLENKVREQAKQLAASLKNVSGRLVKVEDVLSQTQMQLIESEKLSAVGLVAASVAHDIRNLLTPLRIEMALADHDDPSARAESFTTMRLQVDRLSTLTTRLLAMAQPAESEAEFIDIGGLVERTAEILRPQAAQENVTLSTKVSRRLPAVRGDSIKLDQVLVNLALNALQAMRATTGGLLTLSANGQDGGVCIRVVDTGPGIPPNVRRRLFDPFFTTRPDGVGLGLYASRRIVTEHGGVIRVRSKSGRGTQFAIWLPRGELPAEEAPQVGMSTKSNKF